MARSVPGFLFINSLHEPKNLFLPRLLRNKILIYYSMSSFIFMCAVDLQKDIHTLCICDMHFHRASNKVFP